MTIDKQLITAEPVYLELKRIKQFKEDVAARDLAKKQKFLYQTLQDLANASGELRSYRLWMKQQENDKFKQILSKKVVMFKLSELRQSLRDMAKKEQQLLVKIDELQQQKIEANKQLTLARDKFLAARRKVMKFEAIQEMIQTEKLKWQEQTEDKVLEEFTTKKRGEAW